MAYKAKGTYFDAGLSAADKAAVAAYKREWEQARERGDAAGMEAAHARAEAIRAAAGYSGGDDGSDYIRSADGAQAQALAREYRDLYRGENESYAAQQKAQRKAQQAAVEQAVDALKDSRRTTQEQYGALFRQLYLDRMNNDRGLDQRLAAQGVSGGAAESTRLGYDTAYEDALRLGEQSRINALSDIDRAIARTRAEGDAAAAETAAEAARARTEAYAGVLRNLLERQDALDARRAQTVRADADAARAYAQQRQAAAEQAAAAEAAEQEAARRPALSAAQVLAALKAGVRSAPVLAAYEYYYGEPYRG